MWKSITIVPPQTLLNMLFYYQKKKNYNDKMEVDQAH